MASQTSFLSYQFTFARHYWDVLRRRPFLFLSFTWQIEFARGFVVAVYRAPNVSTQPTAESPRQPFGDGAIAVTGMGAICAGGENAPQLWQGIQKGRIATTERRLPHSGRPIPVYAAQNLRLPARDQPLVRRADRAAVLSLVASREAWAQAGHSPTSVAPERLGVVVGSSRGAVAVNEAVAKDVGVRPSSSIYTTFASISGIVSAAIGAEGGSSMVSATCASGAAALQTAVYQLRADLVDVVVVGAVDAPLVDSLLKQFTLSGVLALGEPAELRPFDRGRSGTVLGEGAAFVVLEKETFAQARGAAILGRLASVMLVAQPSMRISMNSSGEFQQRVIGKSLHEAGLVPADIGVLHLHGTGTHANDLAEAGAVNRVFGPVDRQPYSIATKPITGHTLGASSLLQVIISLYALNRGLVPQTFNCTSQDPACALNLQTDSAVAAALDHALCLTSGFWGNAASIVLGKGGP
jgi:3-oxoacyl-(acyl-carrier-protein) synthase